ncbi:MAG TPA: substrate-binding domain-containing protein [Coriobacteriia bacterium]|nr:substrate-binding domain-containing protein [Coriobacteriia bacterium]
MEHLRSIDRLEAVRALSEPHRMEILRLLLARPHTISSLGRAIDKHPAWVRHHVLALEAAGLVHLAEERTTRNFTEKIYRASAAAFTVSLLIRPDEREKRSLVALVSHDLAVELLASGEAGVEGLAAGVAGSLDSLIGVRQGLADIAGCHLLDAESGEFNLPYARHLFPDRDVMVVTLAHREQGLMVAPGNPLGIRDLADVVERNACFVNRNRGSGTRMWIDRELHRIGADSSTLTGFDTTVDTHTDAAALVARGEADAAVGIAAAAERFELGFVPLFHERYDLVMPDDIYRTEEVEKLVSVLHTKAFRSSVAGIRGYDPEAMGDEHRLSI